MTTYHVEVNFGPYIKQYMVSAPDLIAIRKRAYDYITRPHVPMKTPKAIAIFLPTRKKGTVTKLTDLCYINIKGNEVVYYNLQNIKSYVLNPNGTLGRRIE